MSMNETIQITGSVKDGKLALDPSTLDKVAGGDGSTGTVVGGEDPNGGYVAVNAPFDPIAEAA